MIVSRFMHYSEYDWASLLSHHCDLLGTYVLRPVLRSLGVNEPPFSVADQFGDLKLCNSDHQVSPLLQSEYRLWVNICFRCVQS